jgi:hypothetical protein
MITSSDIAVLETHLIECAFCSTTFWSPPITTKEPPEGIGALYIKYVSLPDAPVPSLCMASAVIGPLVLFASVSPIIVVVVETATTYVLTVVADVPITLCVFTLNVLAISYPNAIAIARTSDSKFVNLGFVLATYDCRFAIFT